jgi:DNA-binding MarR family transcriptional regulator
LFIQQTSLSPQRDLLYKLHRATFMLDRQGEQILQEQGTLTFSQFLILIAIKHNPNATQCIAARYLGVTQPAVSRQVDNLVARGLINRVENSESRRENNLSLTAEGERELCDAQTILEKKFEILTQETPSEDISATLRTLDRLIQKLRNDTPNSCPPTTQGAT